jgi:hypothetical protein
MKLRTVLLAFATLAVFVLSAAAGDEARFMARLSGWGKGKAAFKVKPDNGRLQSELQIEGENLAPNTNYTVIIGTDNVWQTRTNGFGTFEVRERAVGPTSLGVEAETPVVVNDTAGNTALSGAFARL